MPPSVRFDQRYTPQAPPSLWHGETVAPEVGPYDEHPYLHSNNHFSAPPSDLPITSRGPPNYQFALSRNDDQSDDQRRSSDETLYEKDTSLRSKTWEKPDYPEDDDIESGPKRPDHRRQQSMASVRFMDRDHPDITMVEKNELDEISHDSKEDVQERADYYRRKFITLLARYLLAYGAPAHRIEGQLESAASSLKLVATFLLLPGVIFASFSDKEDSHKSTMNVIKSVGGISLSRLEAIHVIYKKVTHAEMSAAVAARALQDLADEPPVYGRRLMALYAFAASVDITLLAFSGSFADALVAGACGISLSVLGSYLVIKTPLLAKVFELIVAFVISFVARALYSRTNHHFCYSAISSGGIVLILPGFTVMSAALEISAKALLTGAIKLVYAIFYSLFLGFVQTLGSDLYLRIDSRAKRQRTEMINDITKSVMASGYLSGNGTIETVLGFSQTLDPAIPYPEYNYQGNGCYRSSDWPWYFQSVPFKYSIPLVPVFVLMLALYNQQSWKNGGWKKLIIMTVLGCFSFAGNKVGEKYLANSLGSTLGAFAISLVGTAYARFFKGNAYTLMLPGVLLLVPTGLTNVGGLAKNYSGNSDQFSSGLNTGLAMVRVSIGLTVGLCLASSLVYIPQMSWFDRFRKQRKKSGMSAAKKVVFAF